MRQEFAVRGVEFLIFCEVVDALMADKPKGAMYGPIPKRRYAGECQALLIESL